MSRRGRAIVPGYIRAQDPQKPHSSDSTSGPR